ncbi:hypothetical protein, partial [Paenibacillus terreus]|uniref:hypothetical protein n=1 Tax=Paenibacillus terreus TaxID=1387834 RepID=UPI0035CD39A1
MGQLPTAVSFLVKYSTQIFFPGIRYDKIKFVVLADIGVFYSGLTKEWRISLMSTTHDSSHELVSAYFVDSACASHKP